MGKIIGIDLGTTNSCVALLEKSEPVVLPNSEGSRTTPSIVGFSESGERLVGQVAKRQAITNPENTVFAVKRLIGRKFDSDQVKKAAPILPYRIVKNKNGDAWVQIRGKDYSPAEVSAMVLMKMKQTAEDYLGEPVQDAIVTCPAYFDDSQRQATKDAGKIAGLNVLRIINEPTAAALSFGLDKREKNIKVAVFDLGGGTFDISILELAEGVFRVLSTNGDTFLGGEDFDLRVVDYLCNEFMKTTSIELRRDRMAMQRLKDAAEKAKQELSSTTQTEITLPFITADSSGPKHLNMSLTRGQLEVLVRDLLDRLEAPCRTALKDAGLTPNQLDEVILVGGMSRMPKVQERARRIFGKEPNKTVNPDEVVAIGASIQGAVLKGEVEDVVLLDITPLSLGVETAGGVFTKLIEKNTTIPVRKSQVFSTARDNQDMVSVHVCQGEREMAEDNKTLGRFELVGIPPAPRGMPQIEVAFDIDANGIVGVSAKDLGTGKEQSIRVVASSGLTEQEISRMQAEAEKFRQDDRAKKEFAELLVNAEGLIYSTEKALEEFGELLSEEDRAEIREHLASCKDLAERAKREDYAQLKTTVSRLETVAHRIADAMYKSSSGESE
jgi:molecular chaperone DnaK